MATFPFLSDEWVSEASKIREEYEGKGAVVPHQMKMNLIVTEVPFGAGGIDAHLDTSEGAVKLELGHIEPVDLTRHPRLRHGQGHPRGRQSPGRDAGLHGRPDQGRRGHVEADGPPGRGPGPHRRRGGHPSARHHRVATVAPGSRPGHGGGLSPPPPRVTRGGVEADGGAHRWRRWCPRSRPAAGALGRADEGGADHAADGHHPAHEEGDVERRQQGGAVRRGPADDCTVWMTWIPATVEIWVMSCWVAAAVPSALWSKTLAMDEAMEGDDTPSPMPDRTRATSTRAMPVFRPVRAKTPIDNTTHDGAGDGGRALTDADGHVAGDRARSERR